MRQLCCILALALLHLGISGCVAPPPPSNFRGPLIEINVLSAKGAVNAASSDATRQPDVALSNGDLFTIMGIIIGLAAYVATVRQYLAGKARAKGLPPRVGYLTPPDVLLVSSGLLLILYVGLKTYHVGDFTILRDYGLIMFVLAVLWLATLHVCQWLGFLQQSSSDQDSTLPTSSGKVAGSAPPPTTAAPLQSQGP